MLPSFFPTLHCWHMSLWKSIQSTRRRFRCLWGSPASAGKIFHTGNFLVQSPEAKKWRGGILRIQVRVLTVLATSLLLLPQNMGGKQIVTDFKSPISTPWLVAVTPIQLLEAQGCGELLGTSSYMQPCHIAICFSILCLPGLILSWTQAHRTLEFKKLERKIISKL